MYWLDLKNSILWFCYWVGYLMISSLHTWMPDYQIYQLIEIFKSLTELFVFRFLSSDWPSQFTTPVSWFVSVAFASGSRSSTCLALWCDLIRRSTLTSRSSLRSVVAVLAASSERTPGRVTAERKTKSRSFDSP